MLTPIDIQNRRIKSKMGGYDKRDADEFLEEIKTSYEELYKENQSLKEKITSLSEGIQYYKKMESTLQKALVLAEKTSSETQEAAKTQADSMVNEATAKAEAMTREAKAEAESLRREAEAQAEVTKGKANRELEETRNHVRKLVQSYENYRLQFKKLAEAQIEMLDSESFAIFVPELDELMNDAPSADHVMDNPGIIPINIGSPAPFVELPEDGKEETPKAEEVPVEIPSVSIPVVSEAPFAATPAEETAVEEPAIETPTAETSAVEMPATESVIDDIPIDNGLIGADPIPIDNGLIGADPIPADDNGLIGADPIPADDNGLIGRENPVSADTDGNSMIGLESNPMEAGGNSMIDVSSLMDQAAAPIDVTPTEAVSAEMAASDNTNGIIGDPFVDTGNFIDPIGAPEGASATSAETLSTDSTESNTDQKPEDHLIDINPFNFIDPE